MAKKVFRIHSQGALTNDWFSSTPINSALISSINTNGGDGKKLPTSIPSPFARIDLVRTAFNVVGNSGQLDGVEKNGKATGSDNHKLISDALDIGQILFNYEKYKQDLTLVAWDKKTSLNKLLNGNEAQKHLGKTLDLFLKQDSSQYNFDKLDKIYILKYKYKIIGGTSPRTLFFAAPGVKEIDIKFGNDIMLDDGLHPLYKRDKEYVKYLYSISKTANFNSYFPEFNSYLISSLAKLSQIDASFYNELMTLNPGQYLDSLQNVVFNGNAGQPLEAISGFSLKQHVLDPVKIQDNSDLVITTNKAIKGLKPLVLPVEPLNLRYIYTFDVWNPATLVPVEDKRKLEDRTLPEQAYKYPYLTMNDFLTDSIIKLPYDIDKDKFFTVGENKYLLPLTKKFFDYFNVEDIKDGNFIQFNARAGNCLEVVLNIPIKRGTIQYTKIYYPNHNTDPKKGTIIEKSFAFSIFPFVYSDQTDISYSLGLADVSPQNGNKLDVEVVNTKVSNQNINKVQKQRSESPFITSQTIIQDSFDTVAIKYNDSVNYLIPNWPKYKGVGGDNYEFAIDFGTTNSHIEYKIEGQGSEKAFDFSESDAQIAFLMPNNISKRSEAIRIILDGESHLKQEVISKNFGKDELRNAPFRTCLLHNINIDYTKPTFVFTDANAGFDYEKVTIRKYLKAFTDLKWSKGEDDNNRRLEVYIEELLMLCKNKVLINDGNLLNTKVTWFYPVSMSPYHLNLLNTIWKDNFKSVFGTEIESNNLNYFPESIAPFYFYKEKYGIRTMEKPSVAIDVGGGTTDIMIYADGEPKLISSFKFAGNAIFGDGYNGNVNNNGFVKKYYSEYIDILNGNSLSVELGHLINLYSKNESSTEIINFFFSLHKNKNIKDKQLNNLVDFSKKLAKDSDFKIIFLLFYSSIIFHIAELMKEKGFKSPRNIVFSGTGSKTLQILDSDTDKCPFLTKLFKAIFNSVFDETNDEITIINKPNPKEATCKGAFYLGKLKDLDHTKIKEVNIGNIEEVTVQNTTNTTDNTIKYKDLTRQYIGGVIKNVEGFYELFNKLMIEQNFKETFGVSNESAKLFNEIKSRDLLDYELQGIENLKSDTTDDDPLGETLFFFPLIGKLNELAGEIENQ
jgi:hypothetical protein